MSTPNLYLNLFPESLVASSLDPSDFGSYMAVGTKFYSRGEAIFFAVDPEFASTEFAIDDAKRRCHPHPDGSPKRSAYISTYRVLERIPIEHLGSLYLTTDDGRVLELQRGEWEDEGERQLNLYQELCPATPSVASRLSPREFAKAVTDPASPISFKRIVFADLILRGLRNDPTGGDIGNLPYRELNHLRSCLQSLLDTESKATKNVSRRLIGKIQYRTIRSGFFVADADSFAHYPMPSREALEHEHRSWWRSAQTVSI